MSETENEKKRYKISSLKIESILEYIITTTVEEQLQKKKQIKVEVAVELKKHAG